MPFDSYNGLNGIMKGSSTHLSQMQNEFFNQFLQTVLIFVPKIQILRKNVMEVKLKVFSEQFEFLRQKS